MSRLNGLNRGNKAGRKGQIEKSTIIPNASEKQ